MIHSVAGPVQLGSDGYKKSKFGTVGVFHFTETPIKAYALNKVFTEHVEEPFKTLNDEGTLKDIYGAAYTVYDDISV